MVSLRSTALTGGPCTNGARRNRHDIRRCELCGCPVNLGSLEQHLRGRQHLRNVAANRTPTPVEPEHPPSPTVTLPPPTLPPDPPISQLAPPTGPSLSAISASITVPIYDPPFTVSHESGLDFEVEGTEIGGQHSFPPLSLEILIEETEVVSRLPIRNMKLVPAPGTPESWCELFHDSI
jgi:hypothetical protein